MIKEPIFKDIPSKNDFYFDGGCDEEYAIKTYYNKDINFAKQQYDLFTPMAVIQDFRFIGTRAFVYYIFGTFRYIQTELKKNNFDAEDVSDMYSILVDLLEKHMSKNPKEIQFIGDYLIKFIDWTLINYDKFDIDNNIYGNVKERYELLAQKINRDRVDRR